MKTFAVIVVSLLASSRGWADDVALHIALTPETRFLRSGDPLLLKITVEIRGTTDASVLLPARKFCSLGIFVEFKPDANQYYAASEWGDAAELPVEHERVVLKPRQQFVAYDRLFRSPDGDEIFRKDGDYRIYVVISQSDGKVVKSAPISVAVTESPRDFAELIASNAELLSRAVRVDRAALSKGTDVETLQSLSANFARLKFSNWRQTLEWRIRVLQMKVGSAEERREAKQFLDQLLADQSLSSVRKEVISVLQAQIAVERNELPSARRFIKGLPDSPERRYLELLVKEAEKKLPPATES